MKYFILLAILSVTVLRAQSEEWYSLINESNQYIKNKKYDEALKQTNLAFQYAAKEEFGSGMKQAVSASQLGYIYYLLGDFEKSSEFFATGKNLKYSTTGNKDHFYSVALNNLGFIQQYSGSYLNAENNLIEALKIKENTVGKNTFSYAASLHNLAKLYEVTGKYEAAEKNFYEALSIKESSIGINHKSYGYTLLSLGILYKNLGNFKKAEELIQSSILIFKSHLPDTEEELIQSELTLAMILYATGRDTEAKPIIEKNNIHLMKSLEAESPDNIKMLYDLANIKWMSREYNEAKNILLKIKPGIENIYGKTSSLYASCLNSIGLIYWQNNELDSARLYLSRVIILRDLFCGREHPDYATSISNFAGLLSIMGDYSLAEKYYREALEIYKNQVKDYFPFMSENEKLSFYSSIKDRFDIFNNYALTRVKDNPNIITVILENQLILKSLLLNNSIETRKIIDQSNNKVLKDKFNKWISIREQLARYSRYTKSEIEKTGLSIDSLRKESELIEKSISSISTKFSESRNINSINWEQIQKSLNDDECLVEIVRYRIFNKEFTDKSGYFAIIVNNDPNTLPRLVRIDDNSELENLYFKNYRKSIKHKIPDKDSYQKMWAGIDATCKDYKKIFLSPDGIYYLINPGTFQRPNGSYIFQNQSIVSVTNSAAIIDDRDISFNNIAKTALLIGDPKFDQPISNVSSENHNQNNEYLKELASISIEPLPGTRDEVKNIEEILKRHNWKTELFTDKSARKDLLKTAKSYPLVHIATHSYFLPIENNLINSRIYGVDIRFAEDDPLLRSGMLFASAKSGLESGSPDKAYSGILTSYDVVNLDLNETQLMVLSACETGLGEIINGEGVFGMQRALKMAGAKYLILSLWKVDDKVTELFMIELYNNLVTGSKPEVALNKSRSAIQKKFPDPYYWGAFILIK